MNEIAVAAELKLAVRQVAYFVADVRVAARRHSRLFGSGPFFVMDNVPVGHARHRGRPTRFAHTAAFGQWGNVQLEFIQANEPGPSILHDLFAEGSGREGLHHVACIVENLNATVRAFEAEGFAEAFRAEIPPLGIEGVFIDTVERYGHFVELYEGVPGLLGFYQMVEEAAANYDGKDPLREAPAI